MKAYPYMHKHPTSGQTTIAEGMDLRDWFAGLAMQGITASSEINWQGQSDLSTCCYKIADAMMKQREIKDVPNE